MIWCWLISNNILLSIFSHTSERCRKFFTRLLGCCVIIEHVIPGEEIPWSMTVCLILSNIIDGWLSYHKTVNRFNPIRSVLVLIINDNMPHTIHLVIPNIVIIPKNYRLLRVEVESAAESFLFIRMVRFGYSYDWHWERLLGCEAERLHVVAVAVWEFTLLRPVQF